MTQPLNQILYGPPETGKTYSAIKLALEILAENANEEQQSKIKERQPKSIKELREIFGSQVEFITFHQSYSYEELVEGIKASTEDGKISYEVRNDIFKNIC